MTSRPALTDRPAEEPLTPDELAEMKQHLRFLREHRKILHLRANAQEDLLLNEVREPTRRGVCQHLLSKVDRAHVFGAVERLDPGAATRLCEGVLRISPNIDYLLLYLDCVRRSASGQQAVAALAEALERIDFVELSHGQMRRVLDLIVELFDERQLPQMLLALLEGNAFRKAFDASVAELPEALSRIVVPLRAVQAVVLHDQRNRFGADMLERGVDLLLQGDDRALLRYPPPARRRLLRLAASVVAPSGRAVRVCRTLLESVRAPADEHDDLALELSRHWIASGQEAAARELLDGMLRQSPGSAVPERWLRTLSAPRMGRIALIERRRGRPGRDGAEPEPEARRLSGVSLDSMRVVNVFVAATAEDAEHRELVALLERTALPGMSPLWHVGTDDRGRAYFALPRMGQRLSSLVERRHGIARSVALSAAAEAAALLASLARLGMELPDARPERFELDDRDRLWLADPLGAHASDVERADRSHAELLKTLVGSLLGERAVPSELMARLARIETATQGARLLALHVG